MPQTVGEAVVAALGRHSVELTFGQSLPTAVQLAAMDAGVRQIAYRTENAGVMMADGYARVSNKVPVVTAQNGPAATLLVPGLAEASKASIPIVAIVQEVPRPTVDRNAFQELDHFDLFGACAKWVRRIDDPSRVDDYIDMAFTVAATGRPGPAVILLPLDLQMEPVERPSSRSARLGHFPLDRTVADPEAVAEAAKLLTEAERPLVIAGGGVHISGAHDILSELQELASLPVATTVMGKGSVDERHPLSLGVVGYVMGPNSATRYMRSIVQSSDLVLLVGTRTNQNGTDSWTLYPESARFIHIDVDGQEIGRNYEALRMAGDSRLTLEALLARIKAGGLEKRERTRSFFEREIAEGRRHHQDEVAALVRSSQGPLRPERMMADLQPLLTKDTIVVADASYASVWITNYLRSMAPGMRFLTPRGIAGLGWGFPMALGAKLACPEKPVFCLVGDGGFAHVWSELETAQRMGTKVVVTVLNNQVLGYQKDAEDVRFGRHTDACYFEPVDHAAIARSCGCGGVSVDRPEDYGDALRAALSADRTTVIDVATDPNAYPPITAFEDRLDDVRAKGTGIG